MRYLLAFLSATLTLNAVGQVNPNYNPDYDADSVIGISDILGILALFGDTWDSEDIIMGCTYSTATNYNALANTDDGSCSYHVDCTCVLNGSSLVDDCGICDGDNSTCFSGCGDGIMHEGYDYSTVQIGDQCWFSENLRYLPAVSHQTEYSGADPYYYVYGYEGADVSAAKATENYETYGVLYNWPAAMTQGFCPSGWHIPTDPEWTQLTDFLGGESVAADMMKDDVQWSGSNSSGFSGLPGGHRTYGGFGTIGAEGWWWSSSESGTNSFSWVRRILSNSILRSYDYKDNGFSARCIKN